MYTNQKCDNKDRKDRLTAPSIIATVLLVVVIIIEVFTLSSIHVPNHLDSSSHIEH